jgi:hypothetical protein
MFQAAVPLYGVYDLTTYEQGNHIGPGFLDGQLMHEALEENPILWAQASPLAQVHD